ncbi:hypothetical protein [Pseudokineococcus sp. 1T1Z-3]|uniref:hypothetical protein n=1 Tax=Pseudokineococcus sp. 1T1Z-3 TaxID=3132745 RepID=UPI0030D886D2
METGERLGQYCVYASKHGVITDTDGRPLPLKAGQDAAVRVVWQFLGEQVPAEGPEVTRELMQRLAGDESARRGAGRALREHGRVVADSLPRRELQALPYRDVVSTWKSVSLPRPPSARAEVSELRVVGTTSALDREGQSCAVVHPRSTVARGGTSAVQLRGDFGPAVVARLVVDPAVGEETVRVDQVLRNAMGVEIGERVSLMPVSVPGGVVADRLVSRRQYAICRVQPADLATVEREVCLLDELTLSLLGVASGDTVVLEGLTDHSGGVIASARVRALATPAEVGERRRTLSGGDLQARFPCSRRVLAVYPDLPWIFLDAATRDLLGLGNGRLSAIRVRAARGHQVAKEARELMLVLSVALLGLVTVVENTFLLVLTSVSLLTGAVVLVLTRLRMRLVHPRPRRQPSPGTPQERAKPCLPEQRGGDVEEATSPRPRRQWDDVCEPALGERRAARVEGPPRRDVEILPRWLSRRHTSVPHPRTSDVVGVTPPGSGDEVDGRDPS